MGFKTVLRSVLALAVAALLGGTLLATAPSASAKAGPSAERATQTERLATCNWRAHQCYGAISLNTRTGVVGYANDKRGKDAAIRIAHRSCKTRSEANGGYPGQCTRAGWVRNGCLATAIRINNGAIVEWGSAYAYNAETKNGHLGAKAKARRKVSGPGTVRIAFWLCTSRSH